MPESNPSEKPNAPVESPSTKEVSLRELLTYENPNLAKYQELTEREFRQNQHRGGERFADSWIRVFYNDSADGRQRFRPLRYEKVLPYLQEKLNDQILIDLGGKGKEGKVMIQLAKKCGVRKYLNVDIGHALKEISTVGSDYSPYVGEKRPDEDFYLLSPQERKKVLEAINVQADMLNFVARLPNNSVNFTLNGIDFSTLENKEYRSALREEMGRVTKVGGVIFGIGSDIWPHDDPKWKSVDEELEFDGGEGTYSSQKIFERVA